MFLIANIHRSLQKPPVLVGDLERGAGPWREIQADPNGSLSPPWHDPGSTSCLGCSKNGPMCFVYERFPRNQKLFVFKWNSIAMKSKKRQKPVQEEPKPQSDKLQADHELFLQAFESKWWQFCLLSCRLSIPRWPHLASSNRECTLWMYVLYSRNKFSCYVC